MSVIRPLGRLPALLATLAFVGGCSAPTAPDPSADATAAPGGPSVAPVASATPTPRPSPTPAPTPAPEIGLSWRRVGDRDLVSRPRNGSMYGVITGGPGAIAWGYVYLTGPRIWTTADGLDWKPAMVEAVDDAEPDYPAEVLDITAGGPGFVAIGGYGRVGGDGATSVVWTSVDGTTWDRVPFGPAFERAQMHAVVAWNGGLLAFGCVNDTPVDCGDARVWTSTDGRRWVRRAPTLPDGVVRLGIVSTADARLWSIGEDDNGGDAREAYPRPPRITSADGLTWTTESLPVLGIERLHPLPAGLYLTVSAIAKGPRVVPPPSWVSRKPGVYRSTDRATWEPLVAGKELGAEIIAVGDTLIMVGRFKAEDPKAWRSTDAGATWAEAPIDGAPPRSVTSAMISSVAALPDGTLVAVGTELAGYDPSTAAWVSPPQPGD